MNPALLSLEDIHLAQVRALIADGVLEFYSDLDFLPNTRPGLLEYYERTGYLDDLKRFREEYRPPQGTFFVLQDKGHTVGCGGVRRLGGQAGELVRLWLRPEVRGRGWGRTLVLELLTSARQLGFSELYLDTSRRCVAAVRLFERNGFQPCPPYKESVGEVFLRLDLKSTQVALQPFTA